jgi:hypothetical protein
LKGESNQIYGVGFFLAHVARSLRDYMLTGLQGETLEVEILIRLDEQGNLVATGVVRGPQGSVFKVTLHG